MLLFHYFLILVINMTLVLQFFIWTNGGSDDFENTIAYMKAIWDVALLVSS